MRTELDRAALRLRAMDVYREPQHDHLDLFALLLLIASAARAAVAREERQLLAGTRARRV